LDRRLMRTLASSDWVRQHQNLLLIGPTGIGKSWLACALAHKACRDGFFAIHKRMAELFRDLAVARADGSIGSVLAKLARTDVLVLDDFAMAPMKDVSFRRGCVRQQFPVRYLDRDPEPRPRPTNLERFARPTRWSRYPTTTAATASPLRYRERFPR
jgi:hypothetical protein